jgi:hypothetical protein
MSGTVPGFARPLDAPRIKLPRPESHPDQAALDATFREICLAAAIVLRVPAPKALLGDGIQEIQAEVVKPSKKRRLRK